jgi:voltage-gated potassium channel
MRALLSVVVLVGLYYAVPIEHRPHQSVALRVMTALVLFGVVLVVEIRQISKHDHPTLRAGVALATIIPLFLVLFAWIYLTMSASDPGAFGGQLNRTGALYFTVTVFSTVGFGDIAPRSDPARVVAMVQMLSDLAVVGIVIRLILGAATRGLARVTGLRASDDRPEGPP